MSTISVPGQLQDPAAGRGDETPRQRVARSGVADRPHRFRYDIEGLRAIAVILVVAYHAGVGGIGGGYVGVDVFFVISGFLITTLLYRELDASGRISLARFYARRAIRLLPASTVVVIATLAAALAWMPPLRRQGVAGDALTAAFYGINFRLAAHGTDYLAAERDPSPLQHFWSLAVEEQFYLLWPLLLLVASLVWMRRGRPSVLAAATVLGAVGAGSLAACVWQTRERVALGVLRQHTRAWELAAGSLVALAAPRLAPTPAGRRDGDDLGRAGGDPVLGAALHQGDAVSRVRGAAAGGRGGAVIAGGCADPRWVPGRCSASPLQELGRLSYCWYLWHWPVLILAPHVLGYTPNVWTKLGLMIATLVPASMSLAAVENRVRFHKFFRGRPRRGILLGGALTATAAALAVLALLVPLRVTGSGTAADTARVLASQTAANQRQLVDLIRTSSLVSAMPGNLVPSLTTASKDYPRDGRCIAPLEERSVNYNISQGCEERGDVGSATTVVLFGDSHAEQWFDPLNEIALRKHWKLVVFTKGLCTPAAALTTNDVTGQPYTECDDWRNEAMRRIGELRPAMVLISSRSANESPLNTAGSADDAWAAAWLTTATLLEQLGARPVIIQDTPNPGASIPDCISSDPLTIQRCNRDPRQALDAGRRDAIAALAARNGVPVIDPTPWFCTTTSCPAVVGNTLVYRDTSHVTATYMKLLAPMLTLPLR